MEVPAIYHRKHEATWLELCYITLFNQKGGSRFLSVLVTVSQLLRD